jgi:hypothetical protein
MYGIVLLFASSIVGWMVGCKCQLREVFRADITRRTNDELRRPFVGIVQQAFSVRKLRFQHHHHHLGTILPPTCPVGKPHPHVHRQSKVPSSSSSLTFPCISTRTAHPYSKQPSIATRTLVHFPPNADLKPNTAEQRSGETVPQQNPAPTAQTHNFKVWWCVSRRRAQHRLSGSDNSDRPSRTQRRVKVCAGDRRYGGVM